MARRLSVLCTIALALALGVATRVHADWPPEGVPLCTVGICKACCPVVCPDGAGGAFVLWAESRNENADLYLQRVTASGAIAPGWPADGVPVCAHPATLNYWVQALTPDGLGGVFVTWHDYRNVLPDGSNTDIYAQRVLADGSIAPGWAADGVPVTVAARSQFRPGVIADGGGGAYITWEDEGTWDIHVQRLTAGGEPAPGWPVGGLAVCADPGVQGAPSLISDGTGGAIVAWGDLRDGPIAAYTLRVLPDGSIAPGWPVNGVRIVLGTYMRDLVPDGAGGAYLASATSGFFEDDDYFLQRFTGSGALAPGWPAGGAVVCTAPDTRVNLHMVADGMGGALLAWADYRDFWEDEIFAQRVLADGTLPPGWPVDGLRVTDNAAADGGPFVAPDGMGGAYLTWHRQFVDGSRVVVQRITGSGAVAAGWPANGRVIASAIPSGANRIVADGAGGAIVIWQRADYTIRALRFTLDGPVPVLLSLVSAEATPERVSLRWQGEGAGSLAASVERRSAEGEWERLGRPSADGADALVYEDRTVEPDTRYAYRLAYVEGGGERVTAETWVEVPGGARFALRGVTPNPSVGDPVVRFSLARDEPATLEVYDIHGRRVLVREVGALGAGVHEVRLSARGPLAAGVYAIRLQQGGDVATVRAVIVR